jgi:hypothetical protein
MASSFHMAGIVPIASKPTGYRLPWDDCLIPLAPDYLAIDNAIFQAAMAGCETIWVVANLDTVPLVRKRVGDYIYDPVTIGSNKYAVAPDKYRQMCSIYYVPIPESEEHKSLCLPWSIVKGALVATEVSTQISKWTAPDKFYVSFPYGIFDVKELRENRYDISSTKRFILSYKGKTALDNCHLGFTFDQADLATFVDNFKTLENGLSIDLENQLEHFTTQVGLDTLFKNQSQQDQFEFEPTWFHQIDNWSAYRDFLSDLDTQKLKSPGKIYIHYSEWNPISEDKDE